MIGRRSFLTLLGTSAAAWQLAARAQQGAQRMRRIGVLMNLAADDPESLRRVTAFAQGLQTFGWTDGRNVQIDYRWGVGMPTIATMQRSWSHLHRMSCWPLAPRFWVRCNRHPHRADRVHADHRPGRRRVRGQPCAAGRQRRGFMTVEYSIAGRWLELPSRSCQAP